MLPNDISKDLKYIFSCGSVAIFSDGATIKGYLNKNTRVLYDDGVAGLDITFLFEAKQYTPKVSQIVNINNTLYQIHKIDKENNYLTRIFLRRHKWV